MSLKDDLTAAKALIADPKDWARGSGPLDGQERPCYCVYTACFDAVGGDTVRFYAATGVLDDSVPVRYEGGVDAPAVAFNDDPATTHNAVLALFDRAINAASIASLDAAIAECAKPLPRHA